jgi:glycosyltransferase involved in cell wall biosynthesis
MQKPVILFLMRFHSLKQGSFEQFLILLSQKLKTQYRFVFVFSKLPPVWLSRALLKSNSEIDNIELKTSLRSLFLFNKLLHKYKHKIIHFHFFSLLTPYVLFVKIRYPIKIIFHIHAIIPYNKGANLLNSLLIPIRKYLAVQTIDLAISVSKFVKEKTLEYFSFSESKIVTIYNGLKELKGKHNEQLRKKFLNEWNISHSSFLIIAGGWLTKLKGVDILIRSLVLVQEHSKRGFFLTIIGDGPERGNLENLILELGLSKKIKFLGWRNDVPDILTVSDLVIVPSVVEEAFPYFILEAMRAERPVIASDIGGIPELVDSEPKSGLLFPPGNIKKLAECIIQMMDNPITCQLYGSCAVQKSISLFNINSQIRNLDKVYKKLFG